MYYDLNDIELTSKEIRLLRKIQKNREFSNSTGILHLGSHDLIRSSSSGKLEITGRGERILTLETDKIKRRIVWNILLPAVVSVLTAYITAKFSLL